MFRAGLDKRALGGPCLLQYRQASAQQQGTTSALMLFTLPPLDAGDKKSTKRTKTNYSAMLCAQIKWFKWLHWHWCYTNMRYITIMAAGRLIFLIATKTLIAINFLIVNRRVNAINPAALKMMYNFKFSSWLKLLHLLLLLKDNDVFFSRNLHK